jgi:hypothetical protein
MSSEDATKRLTSKKQTLDDAYAAPANFLEIDVINPITHGVGNKRYTDYEVRMKVWISRQFFPVPCRWRLESTPKFRINILLFHHCII